MRNLLTILIISLIAVLFVGCGVDRMNVTKENITDAIVVKSIDEDENTYYSSGFIPGLTVLTQQAPSRLVHIKKLAEFGKKKGFKYFALINDNFNNVAGFPVTTLEAAKNVCASGISKGHALFCLPRNATHSVITKVVFLKENPNAFPVWNIEQTLQTSLKEMTLAHDEIDKKNVNKYLDFYQY
jgi:hypothetical protein